MRGIFQENCVFIHNDLSAISLRCKLGVADGSSGPQWINFTSPINAFIDVYFASISNPDMRGLYLVTSNLSTSNSTPTAKSENLTSDFNSHYNTTEFAIPFSDLYALGNYSKVNLSLSAFVVGNSGSYGDSSTGWSWVGTGLPYNQTGIYSDGTQPMFTVNDSFVFTLTSISSQNVIIKTPPPPPPPSYSVPINLNIILNDHQPMYKVVGSNNYVLPWTEAHATAEYIERGLIMESPDGAVCPRGAKLTFD